MGDRPSAPSTDAPDGPGVVLGDKVRDTITGMEGIATARCLYLNGCDHIGIQGPASEGKIPPIQWVDEPQVEVKKTRAPRRIIAKRKGGPSTGGAPPQRAHPDE